MTSLLMGKNGLVNPSRPLRYYSKCGVNKYGMRVFLFSPPVGVVGRNGIKVVNAQLGNTRKIWKERKIEMQNDAWKRPRLSLIEIYTEIRRRTGIPIEVCRKVMDVYEDIAKTSLLNGVEVPFLKMGKLTWRVVPPKAQRRCFGVVEKGIDGYNTTIIRFARKWIYQFRDATRIPYTDVDADADDEGEDKDA